MRNDGRISWEAPLQIAQFVVPIDSVVVLIVLKILVVDGVRGQGVVLLVRDVLGEHLLIVMIIRVAWLVVEDVTLLWVRFQVQVPRMNQISQSSVVVS